MTYELTIKTPLGEISEDIHQKDECLAVIKGCLENKSYLKIRDGIIIPYELLRISIIAIREKVERVPLKPSPVNPPGHY